MQSFMRMLTRRTLLKGLGVLGLGVSLPFTSKTSAVPSDLIEAAASPPPPGSNQPDLDLIAAIEAREDVQDDVAGNAPALRPRTPLGRRPATVMERQW